MIGSAAKIWFAGLCVCMLTLGAVGQGSNASAAEHYAEHGQRALAEGRLQDAEKAFEKLRSLEPGVAEVHANLGLVYFQEGKFEEAVSALRQTLKLKPSLTKTDSLLAISLSELGRYNEALPGLETCFRRASTDPEIKRMCGLQLLRVYSGLKRDRNALDTALELNRLYSDDPEILYHTGKIYGNYAFLTMQKLARVAPKSIWRYQTLAEAHESQGAYDSAISEYQQVLAADPHRPGIHYRIGRTLLARSHQTASSSDLAQALQEFQLELEINPSNANASYEIAEAHRNAGQLEEAEKLFEQALNGHPDFEEAQLGLGAVLTSLQRPADALPHLQEAIRLNGANEVAWYRLSQVQRMLGNDGERQKAFTEFERLRREKSSREAVGIEVENPEEVTKQQIDPGAPK